MYVALAQSGGQKKQNKNINVLSVSQCNTVKVAAGEEEVCFEWVRVSIKIESELQS